MPRKRILTFLFYFSICGSSNANDSKPQVTTPLGTLQGYAKTSHGGKPFSAFEGIPYAKPPIGQRRFQESEPADPWIGVLDATHLTTCIQTSIVNPSEIEGEEDCLYINVYVPHPRPNPEEKLEVIVHVHGGAFMFGSGHAYAHPEFFMDRDVIFVTFNYRLSIFGFLSTEDDAIPGNNGLKDQVLALKWVQKNIASFGGNPDSVTLTGLSAGAASVHLHYFSPMSKGLFHRGFSQSGVALNSFAIQEGALEKAKVLGEAVGCPQGSTPSLAQCLKQRHPHQIMSQVKLFYGYLFAPYAPFAPVVEKGSRPFLSKNPYQLLDEGQVLDLPWVTSNTAHEGMFPGIYLYKKLEEIDQKWEELAAYLLDYDHTLQKNSWASTAKKIRDHYLDGKEINEESFFQFVKMLSERLFLVDAEIAAKLQASKNQSPVYYYYFSYPGDHSQMNQTVPHGDDGQYFFHDMFRREEISDNELKMKDIMINMLVSFAKEGTPKISGINWKPTKSDQLTYLNISSFKTDEIKLETVQELVPRTFWKSLGILENENLVTVKDEL